MANGWFLGIADLTLGATGVEFRRKAYYATISIQRGPALLHRDRLNLTSQKSRRQFLRDIEKIGVELDDRTLLALEAVMRGEGQPQPAPGDDSLETSTSTGDGTRDEPPPYRITSGGLIWMRPVRDGVAETSLTNFAAEIVEDVAEDDGVEVLRRFRIRATLKGRTTTFDVPAHAFPIMSWATERLGAEAVVFPGMSLKDHARAAIQLLSGHVPVRHVYAHLGWQLIGGQWVYLHVGGAIGSDGPVPGVEVVLPDALMRYVLPAPRGGAARVAAVQASLGLLDVAPRRITVPLLAAVARAPLGSSDFSLHLSGPTGVKKTELAALGQQHFGAGMDARHLPANWDSTPNANEGLAFYAKDVLLVVDDFAPRGTQADVQRQHRDADRLLRAQANQAGRQRMRPDSTLRPQKLPRGLIVSTGEDVPRGHSLRGRLLTLEVGGADVIISKLSDCQRQAVNGLYAEAMTGFIVWLASQYSEVQSALAEERARLRTAARQSCWHSRTPGIVADLALGLRYYIKYAREVGALGFDEAENLWKEGWRRLLAAGAEQTEHQHAADPVHRFIELLRAAISSGRAHVAASDGTAPEASLRPLAWGWRADVLGSLKAHGERIGWVAGNDVFLEPEAAYVAAQQIARDGVDGLLVTSRTLHKRLHEHKLLVSVEDSRLTVRRTLEDARRYVLHLRVDTLFPELDQLDPLTQLTRDETAPPPLDGGPVGPVGSIVREATPVQTDDQANGVFAPQLTRRLNGDREPGEDDPAEFLSGASPGPEAVAPENAEWSQII